MIQPINQPVNAGKSQEIKRSPSGRFVKGCSGNPQGPKPGYKWVHCKALGAAVEEYRDEKGTAFYPKVVEVALTLAVAGNTSLLCKILDKCIASKVSLSDETDSQTMLPFTVKLNGIESAN